MELGFKNQLVLVTGASAGIGRAIAKAFFEEGARVIINGRHHDRLTELKQKWEEHDEIIPIAADVGTAEGAAQLAEEVKSLGELDILINNVGVFEVRPFTEIADKEWMRIYEVNVLSNVRLMRAFLPGMLDRNHGRIVNISSECGVRGIPQMVHYGMTKSAQLGLSRGVAELTQGTRVTVNSILPGPTWTEGVEAYIEGLAEERGQTPEQAASAYFNETEPTSLIQRFVTPEEVAQTVLLTAANPAINGASVRVEGGIIQSI